MLYGIVYALIINNSKMIDYRTGTWYNIMNGKILVAKISTISKNKIFIGLGENT